MPNRIYTEEDRVRFERAAYTNGARASAWSMTRMITESGRLTDRRNGQQIEYSVRLLRDDHYRNRCLGQQRRRNGERKRVLSVIKRLADSIGPRNGRE